MTQRGESSAQAIWGLTWRSTLLLPLLLPIAIAWLVLVVTLVVLPFFAAVYLWFGLWRQALTQFVVWALLWWAYRRFRVGRIFEWPPSLL